MKAKDDCPNKELTKAFSDAPLCTVTTMIVEWDRAPEDAKIVRV
jgi:hypothetical protein